MFQPIIHAWTRPHYLRTPIDEILRPASVVLVVVALLLTIWAVTSICDLCRAAKNRRAAQK